MVTTLFRVYCAIDYLMHGNDEQENQQDQDALHQTLPMPIYLILIAFLIDCQFS
jgi:hypothetical protein